MPNLFFLVRVAVLAATGAVFCVLVGVAAGGVHWSFDLMGQFLLPAGLVAGGAALVAALCRWPLVAGTAAIAAVASYAAAMPFTTAPAPVTKEAARFKVLLFNVYFKNGRLDQVRKMVEETNADIVVFVETTKRIADELQPLSAIYPYRFDCNGMGTRNKWGCDITIFARSRLTLPVVKETADPERSPVVQVDMHVAGCQLKLFATHMTRPFPNRPWWAQRAQAEEIAGHVAAWPGAKLVLGDFNAAPWGHIIRTIETGGNVRVLTGAGGTWPSILPPQMRIPIDHMLAGPGLTFVSRQVLPKIGSDHLPVVGEIAVTDPSQCG